MKSTFTLFGFYTKATDKNITKKIDEWRMNGESWFHLTMNSWIDPFL